jgi:AcrR family transcriptional regulator
MAKTTRQSPRQRRWKSATHEQRREQIIAAALDLLHRKCPTEVTIRNVARQLGVGAMTLYTYIDGQDELQREMVRRGFDMLQTGCHDASTLEDDQSWRGGAREYLQFAIENPSLYHLMFSIPAAVNGVDDQIMRGGFQHLLDKVRGELMDHGLTGKDLDRQARDAAGRFWIALHGLASLAIAGRLSVVDRDIDFLLDDLLARVAPTRAGQRGERGSTTHGAATSEQED